MLDRAFLDMDLARYRRWLGRMTGANYPLALVCAQGKALWADGEEVAALCEAATAAGFGWPHDGPGMQRHACGEGRRLFYVPIFTRAEALLGYLAVPGNSDNSGDSGDSGRWDTLADTLEDLAGALADEYRLKFELDAMAEELSERYEELHLMYAIDQQVSKFRKDDDVFHHVLKSCAMHVDADVTAFVKPRDNLCVSAANLSAPIHNLDLVLVEMRGDLYRFVNSSRTALVLNDMDDPKRAYVFTDMPFKLLCCPVFEDNIVVAIFVLLNHLHKPDFTNSDRRVAEVLANQMSSMSRLVGMLGETEKFNGQMAAALIESVEAKDPYTRGHSERVHHLAMEIGRAMQLPDQELENLYWGSLLHDVGKIGIPDAVLCKPSRLTKDEYTFIMVHPERSYEILRHIDRFQGAVPGARHHQEKFDGTGYPHGLKGMAIPLNARIIAVADTYDSITSSRAYRAGRSHETAMQEILRCTGTQLDPAVVEVFVHLCEQEPEWLQRFGIRRDAVEERT